MNGSRVYIACKAQLPDIAEPLKPGMTYKVKNEIARQSDKTVYGVIDDLSLVGQ
jgi:hypothetical protein